MKIKKNTSAKVKPFTVVAIIGVFLLSFFALTTTNNDTKEKNTTTSDLLGKRTSIYGLKLNYENLLKEDKGKIFENRDLKIYAVNKSGIAKVIYAYKHKPEGREITDNFFLHLYLKDSTKLMGNARFVNVDFFKMPKMVMSNNKEYYVYHKDLISSNYLGKEVPLIEIDHIRTGRNKPKFDRSLDLGQIPIKDIPAIELESDLMKIQITTKKKDFNKILAKRDEALAIGVLSTQDDDLIKGKIASNDGVQKDIELRLKGDWPDHLRHKKKWSYRIILKNGETYNGMRKFSVQHPNVRNYLWEWLINKVIRDEGIIGLRYDFAEVTMNVKDDQKTDTIDMGVMAVEESFDKILIENNKKREGIIVAFDESVYWSDVKKERELNLDRDSYSKKIRNIKSAPIRVFNENKVLADPKLLKQFETAKDLLDGLRLGKYKASEVFDLDKLTTFVAINNLFNGYHALIWHNLRIYYNPITGKLEPISFDSTSGKKMKEITHYPFTEGDSVYHEMVREKLLLVSSTEYINNFLARHKTELTKLNTSLFTEYDQFIEEETLEYNSNFIKKKIDPSLLITSSLIDYSENTMDILVHNLSEYPVVVSELQHKDGQKLSTNQTIKPLLTDSTQLIRFELDENFVNAFVSKKNKKGSFQFPKDVKKLKVIHHTPGINTNRHSEVQPYGINQELDKSVAYYKKQKTENFQEFSFIEELEENILVFKEGSHEITKDLIIPAGYTIQVSPGCMLDFKNEASLLSYATFISNGTKEKPIKFYSSDGTGRGIFISNAAQQSQVHYSTFDNLSNPKSDIWEVSGAVNFHESEVIITNAVFSNNRCEDGLNIIRSSFTMTDTRFEGTQSDAFDGDFVTGTLERCTFINAGNDGIDVSGSELYIKDITVKNPSDKAISAGENSTITGQDIKVSGGEIGVVSKDLSKVALTNVSIIDTRLGISAFQKKSEYGVASIAINNLTLKGYKRNYLIENKSILMIDNVAVETVDNNVIDQMYGKEYGKSSR
ncbi:hypothetical protein [uncultured Dokdonia sp.]|uniref:hypothetical protein n=1 Tax=uncultured Dokdonia sp. TaxID=575653 RepID=UPI00261426B7|nr:hypothetical protein [uncultured Dokdonia sp.]